MGGGPLIAEWMQEAMAELKTQKYPVEYMFLSWNGPKMLLIYRDKRTRKVRGIQSVADWKAFLDEYKPRPSFGLKKGGEMYLEDVLGVGRASLMSMADTVIVIQKAPRLDIKIRIYQYDKVKNVLLNLDCCPEVEVK